MDARSKRVVGSILNLAQDALARHQQDEAIAAYVAYEQAGGDVKTRFPELYAQILVNSDLQAIYYALRTVAGVEGQAALAEPPRPARFDLSFLRSAAPTKAADKPILWAKVGDAYRLVTQLTAELGERVVTLTNLDALLLPYHRLAPAPAGLQTRSLGDVGPEMQEIQALPSPEHNTRIVLYMGPVQEQKGTVMVQVETIDPAAPVARASVTLRTEPGQLLERILTGADGAATFRGLVPGRYLIQVKAGEQLWEIAFPLGPKRTT